MKKSDKNLLISIIILIPATFYLHYTAYGTNPFENLYAVLVSYIGALIVSSFLATVSWGVFYLVKKKSSFKKALYKSVYLMAFISASVYWIAFIAGRLFG